MRQLSGLPGRDFDEQKNDRHCALRGNTGTIADDAMIAGTPFDAPFGAGSRRCQVLSGYGAGASSADDSLLSASTGSAAVAVNHKSEVATDVEMVGVTDRTAAACPCDTPMI